MKYLGIITRREYLNKIRNRSFVIMTFVSPLILVIFALVIGFLTNVNNKSKAKDIVIVDESGLYANTFENTETIQYEYLSNVSLKDAKAEVLATKIFLFIVKNHLRYRLPVSLLMLWSGHSFSITLLKKGLTKKR